MPKPTFRVSEDFEDDPQEQETFDTSFTSEAPLGDSAVHPNSPNSPDSAFHLPLYLDPADLVDAENVRPGESILDHSLRVKALVKQIEADGQQIPVKVKEEPQGSGVYRIVDGQGRIDALRILNNKRRASGTDPLAAWCVLASGPDSWATSVKLNLQRRNYSDLQLADLIAQARTRYGWDKKGGGRKLADFFGLTEQHLVEYNTLASAPADVKTRMESGELSKSAALTLLNVTGEGTDSKSSEHREKVATVAQVKAQEEIDRKYAASRKNLAKAQDAAKNGKPADPKKFTTTTPKASPAPAPDVSAGVKVKVQARHIVEAAREVAEAAHESLPTPVKRNRTELISAFSSLAELMPASLPGSDAGKAFLNGIQRFADGEFSPKQLQNRWNTLLGIDPGKKKK